MIGVQYTICATSPWKISCNLSH